MKIVFLVNNWNKFGGMEKHVQKLIAKLRDKNYEVKIIQFKYPKIKIIGLLYIWIWMIFNINKFIRADIVHIHDVFIWYLPIRFLLPFKKVYITFHGWEGKYPIPIWNLINKQIANKLCRGSISIGNYIEKFYKIKSDFIIYGGFYKLKIEKSKIKIKNTILFVGRLEADTGLIQFLEWLKAYSIKLKASFVGDGSLRSECEKFGKVYGFCDPIPFYKKAETVVPSGYLTYLEAKSYGCKIKTFYGSELKKQYWEEILRIKRFDTWEAVANKYIKLWSSC